MFSHKPNKDDQAFNYFVKHQEKMEAMVEKMVKELGELKEEVNEVISNQRLENQTLNMKMERLEQNDKELRTLEAVITTLTRKMNMQEAAINSYNSQREQQQKFINSTKITVTATILSGIVAIFILGVRAWIDQGIEPPTTPTPPHQKAP